MQHILCESCQEPVPGASERAACTSPRESYNALKPARMGRLKQEHLIALYLDSSNRVIARETVTVGSLNTTRSHPREILRPAISHAAAGFVLAHNHPSGNLRFSQDDVDFTRAIKRASEIIGIGLYDHILVTSQGYCSMKEQGLI